ncbi:UNVERIFIED_CONTAM: hypothetical protein GTU68_009629 [Idotea baltica]|nr:hypothetical protein [Idotea baltica]
MGSNKTRKIKT